MSNFLLALLLIILGLLPSCNSIDNTRYEKLIKERIKEMNKPGPSMIDETTRFDSVSLLPNDVFAYYYTLVNDDRSTVDVENLKKDVREVLLQRERATSKEGVFKDYYVTISYFFRDKHGNTLFSVAFSPTEIRE